MTRYDPSYIDLPYPDGNVPIERGVCSDVIVRAFRAAGVDLQVEVNRDMKKSFSAYPRMWGLSRPDTNIDHRHAPNLMKFFERKEKSLALRPQELDKAIAPQKKSTFATKAPSEIFLGKFKE